VSLNVSYQVKISPINLEILIWKHMDHDDNTLHFRSHSILSGEVYGGVVSIIIRKTRGTSLHDSDV